MEMEGGSTKGEGVVGCRVGTANAHSLAPSLPPCCQAYLVETGNPLLSSLDVKTVPTIE